MDPDSDADPDADPDPAIFIIYLQEANKKQVLKEKFSCILLFEGTFTSYFKYNESKRSHKTVEIKVLLTNYYICLMIEGSGSATLLMSQP